MTALFTAETLSMEEIRLMSETKNLALFEVIGENLTTKENLIHAIAKAGGFYTPFPPNWDALSDALCDLPMEKNGYVWLFSQWELSKENEVTLTEIFSEVADFWVTQDRLFWVFVG